MEKYSYRKFEYSLVPTIQAHKKAKTPYILNHGALSTVTTEREKSVRKRSGILT